MLVVARRQRVARGYGGISNEKVFKSFSYKAETERRGNF